MCFISCILDMIAWSSLLGPHTALPGSISGVITEFDLTISTLQFRTIRSHWSFQMPKTGIAQITETLSNHAGKKEMAMFQNQGPQKQIVKRTIYQINGHFTLAGWISTQPKTNGSAQTRPSIQIWDELARGLQ